MLSIGSEDVMAKQFNNNKKLVFKSMAFSSNPLQKKRNNSLDMEKESILKFLQRNI
jgi:hypothetical protein